MEKTRHTPHCESCKSRNLSVFCDLTSDEVKDLDGVKTCETFKKGETIFYEGNMFNGMFCVSRGKIKLYKAGYEGKEQIIRFAQPGDVIGYRALLSDEPLSVTAESIDDTMVCFIAKEHLFKMLMENQDFNFKVLKALSHDLGTSTKAIVDLANKPVRERLAESLLMLRDTFELDNQKTIQVRLSREELGNIVGTATESVIRLLSDFKKEGLISLDGKSIRLKNIPALIKLANTFD